MMTEAHLKTHLLADAFLAGSTAFLAGRLLKSNPYGRPGKSINTMAYQWDRGYRDTREVAREEALILARKVVS
jgi:hypothetical protein